MPPKNQPLKIIIIEIFNKASENYTGWVGDVVLALPVITSVGPLNQKVRIDKVVRDDNDDGVDYFDGHYITITEYIPATDGQEAYFVISSWGSKYTMEERLYIFNLLRTNDILKSSNIFSDAGPEAYIAEGIVPIGIKTDLMIEKAGYPNSYMTVGRAAGVFSNDLYDASSWVYDYDEYWCYNISQDNDRDIQFSVALEIKDNVVELCRVYSEKLP